MVVPYQFYQEIILFFNSLEKKKMKENERELLFLVNGDFFKNVREYIIPRRSLVTIYSIKTGT